MIQCTVWLSVVRGHTYCEIYVTSFGLSRVFLMNKESDVNKTLDLFLGQYGVPESLISDEAMAYTGGELKKKYKRIVISCS